MEKQLLKWYTTEFEHYEKGTGWYFTLVLLTVLFISYYVYMKDWFGALTIFILASVVYFFAKIKPKDIEVTVTDQGVYIDTIRFPYSNLKRFWIVHHQKAKAVHLETTAYLNRFIIIQLENQDPVRVAEILREFLPETEANRESLARRLARRLKF